jgi:hypothetical protein
MSNIEIAQKPYMQLVMEIGSKFGGPGDALIQYDPHKVKPSYDYIKGNVEDLF